MKIQRKQLQTKEEIDQMLAAIISSDTNSESKLNFYKLSSVEILHQFEEFEISRKFTKVIHTHISNNFLNL